MKVCDKCGSLAVEPAPSEGRGKMRCKKCEHIGRFKHLHNQGTNRHGFGQATLAEGSHRYMPAGNKHS